MSSQGVLLVDWLGRGGIAQCTESWAIELGEAGVPVSVVTRRGRELGAGSVVVDAPRPRRSRFAAHRAIARHAAELVDEQRPSAVVIQNYIIPPLERPVYQAARRTGSRLIVVIHDHRHHSRWAGSSRGLGALLARADTVLAHSEWVAGKVEARAGRRPEVIPLPVPRGLLAAPARPAPFTRDDRLLLALHYGVLHRGYKGSRLVAGLAGSPPPRWQLAAVGAGAPTAPGLLTVDRFLEAGELTTAVAAADAALLPYTFATQSAAVLLAQVLGTVPIATAVGGIPEQVQDGATGRLLPLGAPPSAWRAALLELDDDGRRAEMAGAAQAWAWAQHGRFRQAALDLVLSRT